MESAKIETPKPQARSKIGNASALLANVDGRSATFRRYRDILSQLVSDMGGDPSEAEMTIARRAATLATWCEQAESEMANGNDINIGEFTTATNALRRLLADIGLQRRARDVTPSLAEIIKGEAA